MKFSIKRAPLTLTTAAEREDLPYTAATIYQDNAKYAYIIKCKETRLINQNTTLEYYITTLTMEPVTGPFKTLKEAVEEASIMLEQELIQ